MAKTLTGTRIRFWPDQQVFVRGAVWSFDALAQRARQTAYLVPGLAIKISDERADADRVSAGLELVPEGGSRADGAAAQDGPREAEFRFAGGISEFVEFLAPDAALTGTWRIQGTGPYTETVPVLQENGHMVATELSRECEVDIALRWGAGYDTVFRSFVNIIATPKGGTHQAGQRPGPGTR